MELCYYCKIALNYDYVYKNKERMCLSCFSEKYLCVLIGVQINSNKEKVIELPYGARKQFIYKNRFYTFINKGYGWSVEKIKRTKLDDLLYMRTVKSNEEYKNEMNNIKEIKTNKEIFLNENKFKKNNNIKK